MILKEMQNSMCKNISILLFVKKKKRNTYKTLKRRERSQSTTVEPLRIAKDF